MNIDHRQQFLGPLPERVERRVVEILAVGVAVDHGAAEIELAHAPLEFVGRRTRILHGKMREARISVGPFADLARQKIIGLAGPPHGSRGIALGLYARPGDRKDRADDACTVHRLKPHVAEIGQALVKAVRHFRVDGGDRRPPVILIAGRQKMLFKRDFVDHAFSSLPMRQALSRQLDGGL